MNERKLKSYLKKINNCLKSVSGLVKGANSMDLEFSILKLEQVINRLK